MQTQNIKFDQFHYESFTRYNFCNPMMFH